MAVTFPGKFGYIHIDIIRAFFSDYVFNLSRKTLSTLEIKVLKKGLGFSPTPSINEVDLRRDMSNFSRKIRCKWFFRNERQENVSETSESKIKSTWNPPEGAPALKSVSKKLTVGTFLFVALCVFMLCK